MHRERKSARRLPIVLCILLLVPVLSLGGVPSWALFATLFVAITSAIYLRLVGEWELLPEIVLILAVIFYCCLQAMPIPQSVVGFLSPRAEYVWSTARHQLLLSDGTGRFSLSLDPTTTFLEAVRWILNAFALAVGYAVGKRRGLTEGLVVISGVATVLAVTTLAHGVFGVERIYGFYSTNVVNSRWATSPLVNPNNLAGFLNLGLFSCSAIAMTTRRRARRFAASGVAALLLSQVVLSGSRGGVAAAAVGLVGIAVSTLFRRRRQSATFPVLAVMLVVGSGFVALLPYERVLPELQVEGFSKFSVLTWAQPILRDYFWFGCGAGAFEGAVSPLQPAHIQSAVLHPENFAFAWLAEWGVPIGGLFLVLFGVIFRPRKLGTWTGQRSYVASIGCGIFLIQNLADVAFSVPACTMALFSLMGVLRGSADKEKSATTTLPTGAVVGPTLLGLSSVFLVWGLVSRPLSVVETRNQAHRMYRSTDVTKPNEVKKLLERLETDLMVRPADPYLATLMALGESCDPAGSPLKWYGHALSLAPKRGQIHFLLAGALERRGAKNQALMELRTAVTYDEKLVQRVAEQALVWAEGPEDLFRAIPLSPVGARVVAGVIMRAPGLAVESRLALLDEGRSLDPNDPVLREQLIRALLDAEEQKLDRCRNRQCVTEARRHLSSVQKSAPPDGVIVEMEGVLLAAEGQAGRAAELLLTSCPREPLTCLETALRLAQAGHIPIEPVATALVSAACPNPEPCARAHLRISRAYREQGGLLIAAKHLKLAATAEPTARAWLRYAETAVSLQLRREALLALRMARSLSDGDAELRLKITGMEKSLP